MPPMSDLPRISWICGTIGVLIIRIGFGTHYTIIITGNPKKNIGNWLFGGLTGSRIWELTLMVDCRACRV